MKKNILEQRKIKSEHKNKLKELLREHEHLSQRTFPCRCCQFFSAYLVDIQTKQKIPLKYLNYEIEIIDSLAYHFYKSRIFQ